MLNDASNNNDVMRVANIVLNEVHLTTMGAQQFSVAALQPSCRKANLPEVSDNDTITKKVVRIAINFALGKNGGYMRCSLGGKLVNVGRQ